jgi:hypothetical protein
MTLIELYTQLKAKLTAIRDILIGMNPDTLLPDWSVTVSAHHNVRVLCDLEGLSYVRNIPVVMPDGTTQLWSQKDILTACVMEESGFHINAVNHNYVFENGVRILSSTDNGLCQWNDYFHGKEITPDQALHDPEMAVRLMCSYWKTGKMAQWCSYSSGEYRKWLGRV